MNTWQRIASLLLLLVTGMLPTLPAQAQDAPAAQAAWLEPRGLSVVDLVGLVPEAHLRDSILVFTGGSGILQYLEGTRYDDQVTVRVKVGPRMGSLPFTQFNCLGKRAFLDEWPLVVPASQMRIFSAGREVTDQVHVLFNYYPAGQVQPLRGAKGSRYGEIVDTPLTRLPNGALQIPANMGCTLYLPGKWTDLTAEFIFTVPQRIAVQVLGSETFTFHSYIGPGGAGKVDSLNGQMASHFGNRHEKRHLNVPPGADYVWVNFPPTPVSPYSSGDIEYNVRMPGSGTYRLATGTGMGLSVDHTISQGLPLTAQFVDSDLSGGDFLPRLGVIDTLAGPEVFVPPGIAYDPCMKEGGCSDELLQQIYETPIPVTIYYYKVSRVTDQLAAIPLRQVAKGWDAASAAGLPPSEPPDPASATVRVTLPLIFKSPWSGPTPLPDDLPQEGCPCGWFDADGRMLDVIPGL